MSLLLPFHEFLALFVGCFVVANYDDCLGQQIAAMMPLMPFRLYKRQYLSLISLLTYLA